jgi:hypothetical protein
MTYDFGHFRVRILARSEKDFNRLIFAGVGWSEDRRPELRIDEFPS